MTRGTAIVDGLIGGAAGAGCMSVLRMAARRFHLIDMTPPQATKARITRLAGVAPSSGGSHHLMDSLIHLAVGAGGGAVYGSLMQPGRRPSVAAGALFGAALWAVAFGALAPALGITRSPLKASAAENAVNLAAHLLYGIGTAVVAGELNLQAAGRGTDPRALRARVG